MSFPNYILLGAAKSATTSIYDILKQHQDIFAPEFKEPHFFDFDENFSKGLDWYSTTYYKNVKKRYGYEKYISAHRFQHTRCKSL